MFSITFLYPDYTQNFYFFSYVDGILNQLKKCRESSKLLELLYILKMINIYYNNRCTYYAMYKIHIKGGVCL